MRRCSEDRQWIIWVIATAMWLCAGVAQAGDQCTFFVRAGVEPPAEGPLRGLSPETAFDRISDGTRALSNPGDVLCVGPGRYLEGNIEVRVNVGGSPVVIRADATGQSTGDPPGPVEIVAPETPTSTTGFLVRGSRDLVIDGFSISGFTDACIQVRAADTTSPSRDVTIRNNYLTGCTRGIDVLEARDRIVVEGNTAVANRGSGISLEACLFENPTGRCRFSGGAAIRPLVSNNRVGGNGGVGIFIKETDDAVIQNNVVYANDNEGIALHDAYDTMVVNNLVYANEQQGLSVGKLVASPGTIVLNNTFYANGFWGIDIGTSTAGSPGAAVVNNIIWRNGNGENGIGVLNENSGLPDQQVRPASTCRYRAGFNLVLDRYGDKTPFNAYDRNEGPLFIDPAGPDGILGGEGANLSFIDRSADDDFRLRQLADEGGVSAGFDAGSATVSELGLTGSTATDGRPDRGTVDIGFHHDASPDQVITFAPPFMPIYVRARAGSDAGHGLTPATALSTIAAAALRAQAGITVVVGPGRYPECNLGPPTNRGLAVFLADPTGDRTGDGPGAVVVEAGRCRSGEPGETGFDISSACAVVVDGFHVTGAEEDGIRVDDDCDAAVLRNNVAFENGKHGIEVINSADVRVANNLAFANARGGIAISSRLRQGPTPPGSRRAVIEFNTAFKNDYNGIQVGDGTGVSSHATVRYNVTGENGQVVGKGILVGDNERRQDNLREFVTKYNLVADGYGTGIMRGEGDLLDLDLTAEPLYLDPSEVDLPGDWLNDRHFRLVQTAAGQAMQSRAVDHGRDLTALAAGLADRTTRSDGEPDEGAVDLGYHYPRRTALVGDCDGDGAVRINELILAVNIALGNAPMSRCLAVDADGDGAPAVSELVRAVGNGLRG